jgi:integrase/recombinase XerD
MSDPLRVEMSGPLSVFAAGFLEELLGRGYRPGTAAKQLQLMAHLSRWMAVDDLEPGALRRVEVERFVQERRASHTHLASARTFDRLLGYLRGLGVVPPARSREDRTPAGALIDRYATYLLVRRGLNPSTSATTATTRARSWLIASASAASWRRRRWTWRRSTSTSCESRSASASHRRRPRSRGCGRCCASCTSRG